MKETIGYEEMMRTEGAMEKADRKQTDEISGKNYQNRKYTLLTL